MRRGTAAVVAVVLGLSAAGAAYTVTQVVRLGCVQPFCPPGGVSGRQTGAAPTAFPRSMAGTWTGTIHQTDERDWSIKLSINEGATLATVVYPDLGCTGTVTFSDATTTRLRARELIKSGGCTPSGTVTLAAVNGGLDWTYRPDGDTYEATGRLERAAPSS